MQLPHIYSIKALLSSFIFLVISFFFQAIIWHQILKSQSRISIKDAISSFGLSVFTKYIPGKIMVILGKVFYINNKYNYAKNILIARSLDAQIITLWFGLIFGSIPFFSIESFENYQIYYILVLLSFSLFIFTNTFHKLGNKVLALFAKKDIEISKLNFWDTLVTIPSVAFYWLTLTFTFSLFVNSLTPEPVSFWIGFTFPLAVTLGIITVIAPGGIGAREGILVLSLNFYGLDIQTATTISVASRLLFLSGEFFIFLLALFLNSFNAIIDEKK